MTSRWMPAPCACPKCEQSSPCIDYNAIDNGVGMHIFERQYECLVHGIFGEASNGDLVWMPGCPLPDPPPLTATELQVLDAEIGWPAP